MVHTPASSQWSSPGSFVHFRLHTLTVTRWLQYCASVTPYGYKQDEKAPKSQKSEIIPHTGRPVTLRSRTRTGELDIRPARQAACPARAPGRVVATLPRSSSFLSHFGHNANERRRRLRARDSRDSTCEPTRVSGYMTQISRSRRPAAAPRAAPGRRPAPRPLPPARAAGYF